MKQAAFGRKDADGRRRHAFGQADAEASVFAPYLRLGGGGADRSVGYRRQVLPNAVDEDFHVGAHVFHQVGAVGSAGHDGFAATGGDYGFRLAVIRLRREVEAEGVPRLHLVAAG